MKLGRNYFAITVTRDDLINSGGYCSNLSCPIATATKRMLPGHDVSTGGTYVRIDGECWDMVWGDSYRVGISAQIVDFCKENGVPFTVVIRRPVKDKPQK